jgi:hypothetical protein
MFETLLLLLSSLSKTSSNMSKNFIISSGFVPSDPLF